MWILIYLIAAHCLLKNLDQVKIGQIEKIRVGFYNVRQLQKLLFISSFTYL